MLTQPEKRALLEKAHALNPVVMIGKNGLSESVLQEIDAALNAHELIKIKVLFGEKEEREMFLESISSRLCATPLRIIGKTLVIFREGKKD